MLLVGANSGYITSLVAQVVGEEGTVWTISSNDELLKKCKERCKESPYMDIMKWKTVISVQDVAHIQEVFEHKVTPKY